MAAMEAMVSPSPPQALWPEAQVRAVLKEIIHEEFEKSLPALLDEHVVKRIRDIVAQKPINNGIVAPTSHRYNNDGPGVQQTKDNEIPFCRVSSTSSRMSNAWPVESGESLQEKDNQQALSVGPAKILSASNKLSSVTRSQSSKSISGFTSQGSTPVEPIGKQQSVQKRRSSAIWDGIKGIGSAMLGRLGTESGNSLAEVAGRTSSRRSSCKGARTSKLLQTMQPQTKWERWTVKPDGPVRITWDSAGLVFLVIQVLYIPFEMAFIQDTDKTIPKGFTTFLTLIDVFWIVDMLLNFRTGFYDTDNGLLQLDVRSIGRRYLRTWFVVDLLSTIQPVLQWIMGAVEPNHMKSSSGAETMSLLRALKLAKFLRIARLLKLEDQLLKLEVSLQSMVITSILGMLKLLLLPFVVSHFTACLLWAFGRGNMANDNATWITQGLEGDDPVAENDLTEQYICAMYFSVTVMSTVGFGDISSKASNERCILMVMMMFTSALVGVVVNGISGVVAKMTERSALTRERLTQAAMYMNWYSVPIDLQVRVKQYLELIFESKERLELKKNLQQWMKSSGLLYEELNIAITGRCLVKHRLLSKMPQDILGKVCDACETIFRPPGDIVTYPGTPSSHLFYIRSGTIGLVEADSVRNSTPFRSEKSVTGDDLTSRIADRKNSILGSIPVDKFQSEFSAFSHANSQKTHNHHHSMISAVSVASVLEQQKKFALTAGDFLGEYRLFIDETENSSSEGAVCISFCELIGLEVHAFRKLLLEKDRQLLMMLSAYAASALDMPQALQYALEDMGMGPNHALPDGEFPVHECTRRGAVECISMLVTVFKADPNYKDHTGRTPLQIAAEEKQKQTFEALILHGATPTAADMKADERLSVVKRRLEKERNIDFNTHSSETYEAFVQRLGAAGLDLDAFGVGDAKSLRDLFEEQQKGESICMLAPDRKLKRFLHVIRAKLCTKATDGEGKILYETESEGWLKSGVANITKLPAKKMLQGKLDTTLEKLLASDLGMTPEWQKRHLRRGREVLYEEEKPSSAYPGLMCVYVFHEIPLFVRQPADSACAAIGLPDGVAFKREEENSKKGPRTHLFIWQATPDINDILESVEQYQADELSRRTLIRGR